MKKKEKIGVATKTDSELTKLASDLSDQISKLSVDRFTEQQKNTRLRRGLRKKRALVKTVLRMRQLGGAV